MSANLFPASSEDFFADFEFVPISVNKSVDVFAYKINECMQLVSTKITHAWKQRKL